MADEKLREVLEEEELIKRIADLPDIESMRRVIQTIEDKEKRERIIDRVATILEERERQKLRPIDREAIVEAILYKRYAAGIAIAIGIIMFIAVVNSFSFGFLLFGIVITAIFGYIAYVAKKWADYIIKGKTN